jgi:hypothetical protein
MYTKFKCRNILENTGRKIGHTYTRIELRELGSEDGRQTILPQDHIL